MKVIVLFSAPDGEHVGHFDFDMDARFVSEELIQSHAQRHFAQRPHTKLIKAWASRGPDDLQKTVDEVKAKYPNRPTVQEITGGKPTRMLVDHQVFPNSPNDPDAED